MTKFPDDKKPAIINMPGLPHQDTLRSRPSDDVYRKGYNRINWGSKEPPTKEISTNGEPNTIGG